MKEFKSKNSNPRIQIQLLIFLLFFISCKEDLSLLKETNGNYVVTINYQEERLTFTGSTGSDSTNNPISAVIAEPKLSRQQINIGILSDGTSEITTTFLEPKNAFRIPRETLPDPDPQLHSIRYANGMAYKLDKAGNLMGQCPVTTPSFAELLVMLKKNNNHLNRNIYYSYVSDLKLKSATTSSADFMDEGDFYVTQTLIDATNSANNQFIGYTVYTYFHKSTSDLAAQMLVDETDKVKFRSQFSYSDDINNPMPEFTREESFETNPNGEEYVITTLTTNENVEIICNL